MNEGDCRQRGKVVAILKSCARFLTNEEENAPLSTTSCYPDTRVALLLDDVPGEVCAASETVPLRTGR